MFSSSSYDRFGGGSGRGRGRGRGGHAAGRQGNGKGRHSAPPKIPIPPIGPLLTIIHLSELEVEHASSSDARITGVEDVASYNWLNATEPTILTPGTYSCLKHLHCQKKH